MRSLTTTRSAWTPSSPTACGRERERTETALSLLSVSWSQLNAWRVKPFSLVSNRSRFEATTVSDALNYHISVSDALNYHISACHSLHPTLRYDARFVVGLCTLNSFDP
jgi:hypothetical protein